MKTIKLKREIVFEESSEELYDVLMRKFGTKTELKRYNEEGDIDIETDIYTNSDAEDIPIEVMKVLIQKAEDAGANFISIDYHCDHVEYDVYGSKITRVSDIDAKKIEEKEKVHIKLKKEKKIQELEKEIERLKK